MPTLEELAGTSQDHAVRIAVLEKRANGVDAMLQKHDDHLVKLDGAVSSIREILANVATKDDIYALSNNINQAWTQQMTQAHNSVPAKIAAGSGVLMFLLALIGFAMLHLK